MPTSLLAAIHQCLGQLAKCSRWLMGHPRPKKPPQYIQNENSFLKPFLEPSTPPKSCKTQFTYDDFVHFIHQLNVACSKTISHLHSLDLYFCKVRKSLFQVHHNFFHILCSLFSNLPQLGFRILQITPCRTSTVSANPPFLRVGPCPT